MSPSGRPSSDLPLEDVRRRLISIQDLPAIVGDCVRTAFDVVLDGQKTGRWDIDALEKTEKTYIGTRIQVELVHTLGLERGSTLDCKIEGHEVDIKYSQDRLGQMIPMEAVGQLCLLIWASDRESRFSVGLLRANADLLGGDNRDKKRKLLVRARSRIQWIISEEQGLLPNNPLLQLDAHIRERILSFSDGQPRIVELFRLVQRVIIPRSAVETVAQQIDPLRRARNARKSLAGENIMVLGHERHHQELAATLGLPVPRKGEYISVTVSDIPRSYWKDIE